MDVANTANVVYVLNGANINMLEFRPPQHYHTGTGTSMTTYDNLYDTVIREGAALGLDVRMWQSNSESAIITKIQTIVCDHATAGIACRGVIINAGAYTHTSIAIADALEMLSAPVVEVHLSNIYAREGFRHRSYISPISRGVIAGLGVYSYVAALHYIANHQANHKPQ